MVLAGCGRLNRTTSVSSLAGSLTHDAQFAAGRRPQHLPAHAPPNGHLILETELEGLIRSIWHLHAWEYSGPVWANYQIYKVDLVMPRGTADAAFTAMLQLLIIRTLDLRYHLENRVAPMYAVELTAGKQKPSLPLADGTIATGSIGVRRSGFHADALSLDELASGFLTTALGHPVIDNTGDRHKYVVDLDWSADFPDGARNRGLINLDAIIESLNKVDLRLEPRTGSFHIMVVDHLNMDPT